MCDESSTNVMIKAMEVEQAAFDTYKGDNPEYRSKLRSLFQNLKAKDNRELGPKVMSGEIPASRFVVMSHEDLKSSSRKAEDAKLQKDNMKKAQVPMAEKSISDALKCGKCGQKKVSYSQAQTRSADEPMTTFCECTVCGNRWKVRMQSTDIFLQLLMILVLLSLGIIQLSARIDDHLDWIMAPSLICGYLHTKFHFFFVLYGWLWGSGFPLTDFGSMRAHEIKKRCFEFHVRCLCIRASSWRFVQYPVGHVAWHMLLEDNRTSCKHDFSSTSRFLVTLSGRSGFQSRGVAGYCWQPQLHGQCP